MPPQERQDKPVVGTSDFQFWKLKFTLKAHWEQLETMKAFVSNAAVQVAVVMGLLIIAILAFAVACFAFGFLFHAIILLHHVIQGH
jgi:hypothetical protein